MANITQWRWEVDKAGGVVIFLLGLALLTATGSTGCRRSPTAQNSEGKDSADVKDKGVLHLEPFVVNLADTENNSFLRVGIDLGLDKPLSGKEGEASSPRIRDCIICVLSTWRSEALLAPDGKQKLKEEILHAVKDRVPELGAQEVYLTEFLVQR
jgi:flagellar FliL protein